MNKIIIMSPGILFMLLILYFGIFYIQKIFTHHFVNLYTILMNLVMKFLTLIKIISNLFIRF